jgi:hypothetical protein
MREPTHQFVSTPRREGDLRRGEAGQPVRRDFIDPEMRPARSNQPGSERVWSAGGGSAFSANRVSLESQRRTEDATRRHEAAHKSNDQFEKHAHKDSETRFQLIEG